jgi:thiosulfate dehydrogenase [quinone] large subunit
MAMVRSYLSSELHVLRLYTQGIHLFFSMLCCANSGLLLRGHQVYIFFNEPSKGAIELMSVSSARNQKGLAVPSATAEERGATVAPITLSERSILGLALIRIAVGYLWFQQLFWKLPPDFGGLHKYVVREAQSTFLPGYSYIIQNILLPNFGLLGAGTWTAELVVSICLLFGLFTRFGALLSTILAIQLYIGLAYAPGEWYWTYGMLILLGLTLTAVPAGRRLGVDQWLAPHLQAAASTSRIAHWLSWLV